MTWWPTSSRPWRALSLVFTVAALMVLVTKVAVDGVWPTYTYAVLFALAVVCSFISQRRGERVTVRKNPRTKDLPK